MRPDRGVALDPLPFEHCRPPVPPLCPLPSALLPPLRCRSGARAVPPNWPTPAEIAAPTQRQHEGSEQEEERQSTQVACHSTRHAGMRRCALSVWQTMHSLFLCRPLWISTERSSPGCAAVKARTEAARALEQVEARTTIYHDRMSARSSMLCSFLPLSLWVCELRPRTAQASRRWAQWDKHRQSQHIMAHLIGTPIGADACLLALLVCT
jgi:hypothetical protein